MRVKADKSFLLFCTSSSYIHLNRDFFHEIPFLSTATILPTFSHTCASTFLPWLATVPTGRYVSVQVELVLTYVVLVLFSSAQGVDEHVLVNCFHCSSVPSVLIPVDDVTYVLVLPYV
jgi:hypothetical protein